MRRQPLFSEHGQIQLLDFKQRFDVIRGERQRHDDDVRSLLVPVQDLCARFVRVRAQPLARAKLCPVGKTV